MSTKILKNAPLFHHIDTRGSGYFCVGFCSSQSNVFFTGHFPPCLNLNQSRREGVGNKGLEEGSACENPKGWRVNVPRSSPYQVTGSSGGWWHPCLSPLGKQTHQLYSIHFQNFLESSMEASVSHPLFLSPSPWFYSPPRFLESACLQTGKLNSGFREAKSIKQRDEGKE